MDARWFLSQFYEDPALSALHSAYLPVCTAYGGHWQCPSFPADLDNGWALVQMLANAHQIEAAKQDPRVIVCPLPFDPAPLAKPITDAYESWGAKDGMSFGQLLAMLAEAEPSFGRALT